MNWFVLNALGTLFFVYRFTIAESNEAKVLLEYEHVDDKATFKLKQETLEEIRRLQGPIRIIAAIGNARVGKSTTLNLISHIMRGKSEKLIEEVFKTGDSFKAVTHGVWAYIIQPESEKGSILLMDVEGTDLGNDSITAHLSMFTAMMSSELSIFAKDVVGNSDRNFLYQISVLSEDVFPNISLDNFPKLRVVIRSDLKTPSGDNIHDFTRNAILETSDQGKVIKKYFPRESIEVNKILFVKEPDLFKDFEKLRVSSYWSEFTSLTEQIKRIPEKKTLNGSLYDGQALIELAKTLKDAMNVNSWLDFGNPYSLLEKALCSRRRDKLLSKLTATTSKELESSRIQIILKFSERCSLVSETILLQDELQRILLEKRKLEEEDDWLTWAWKKKLELYSGLLTTVYVLSDIRLKQDIVAEEINAGYNDIGLQEVCWKWNALGEKRFGLAGRSCGVIAQEVHKIYPWAVMKGDDGYLRVAYNILRQIRNNSRASYPTQLQLASQTDRTHPTNQPIGNRQPTTTKQDSQTAIELPSQRNKNPTIQ